MRPRVLRREEYYALPKVLAIIVVLTTSAVMFATVFAPRSLQSGGPIAYYVISSNEYLDRCVAKWHFGDKVICKTDKPMPSSYRSWPPAPAVIPTAASSQSAPTSDTKALFHNAGKWLGAGITVAIIDTGIDYLHPTLNNSIVEMVSVLHRSPSGGFLRWIPRVNGSLNDLKLLDNLTRMQTDEFPFADELGHGTHVASIIAGQPSSGVRGIAPMAKLFMVKAFYKNGYAGFDDVMNALQVVYDSVERLNIKVVNLSWGALLNSDGSDPVSVAAAEIAKKDVLVFAAAGNEGNLPVKILTPAVSPEVIALGAINHMTGKIAPFSSWGTTVDLRMKPDFVAAGVDVIAARSTFSNLRRWPLDGRFTWLSGTSMSTAVASGIGAAFAEYHMAMGSGSLRKAFAEFQNLEARRLNPYKDFISGMGILMSP